MAMDEYASLRQLVRTHPLIDNHAHNMLGREDVTDYDSYPLESIVSEAHGRAITNSHTTLPLLRAIKQLSELYETSCSSWDELIEARHRWVKDDYEGLVRRCLEGTHTLLLDDLLSDEDVEAYTWHDRFTTRATRRIVRIEAVAASLLVDLMDYQRKPDETVWGLFRQRFLEAIDHAMNDPAVVGFKSVVCYRTGLDVDPYSADEDALTASLHRTLDSGTKRSGYRVEDKPLNDWLVQQTLKAITSKKRAGIIKPIQFHTGLGDNDISLVKANPAYMQPLIAQYQDADIVLLHSAYPYTQEAGYLASVYPNVYLDLGEVFPMVSRDGQEKILRQSLEIVPINRLLWSTDGHFHPESYWLANRQFRQALEKVLVEYVQCDDLSVTQAEDAVKRILFENSNCLYKLNASINDKAFSSYAPPTSISRTKQAYSPSLNALDTSLEGFADIQYIWTQWIDYTATLRVRIFPIAEFVRILRRERRIGVSLAVLWMLNDDTVLPEGSTTGQFYLEPDLSSLFRNISIGSSAASATIMNFWRSEDNKPLEGCPRSTLEGIVQKLRAEKNIDILCGFEIEVILLNREKDETGKITDYTPATTNHSWSQMTSETRKFIPLLEEIHQTLVSIGINLQQFHTESAPGQFEFVLPPLSPLIAVDTLYTARQVITTITEKHGLRATLHPRPFPKGTGSAAHTHISISQVEQEESFLAGILDHFPAIAAFTLSQDASYERVRSGIWAGSEWVTWGFQNREAPIRKISQGHWEFKSIDGVANAYLATAALLAGGYLGLNSSAELKVQECIVDASTLSPEKRAVLGITTPLPKCLSESLLALERDEALQQVLGPQLVSYYISVKRAESERLLAMTDESRRFWLLERY